MQGKRVANFALIGVGGYIAPRHLEAIRETGNTLVATLDKNDSVGIIDSYFPEAAFFTEFERFDRHIEKLRDRGEKIDYVSICSPNYLHDAHIRFALRIGASAICEKPLVLNPWNLDLLEKMEKKSEGNIYSILQLRYHESIMALKKKVEQLPHKIFDVSVEYISSRGKWYDVSWKGDIKKSGGVATNIGVHLFDMLIWIFGEVKQNDVFGGNERSATGVLMLERANVNWFLSVENKHIPEGIDKPTYRSIRIGGEEIEFSKGFKDLHKVNYQKILTGAGFGVKDVRPSIELISEIRGKIQNGNSKENSSVHKRML